MYFKPVHIDACPFDDSNKIFDAFLYQRVNDFLHKILFTPDRKEKLFLYRLIISVAVGYGHFSNVPPRSLSVERSSA